MRAVKYSHLVPDNHRCTRCHRYKDETNFKVRFYKDKHYVSYVCYSCIDDRDKPFRIRKMKPRKKREVNRKMQKKPTAYSELVPEDHECIFCGKTKAEVNFRVVTSTYTKSFKPYCNQCFVKGLHKGKPKELTKIIPVERSVRTKQLATYSIKKKIDLYFKENY